MCQRFSPDGRWISSVAVHRGRPAVARELARVEIANTSDRLFLPMTESAGTIWMVEGVDR